MAGYSILALGGVGSVGRAALEDVLKHGPFDEVVVGDIDVARARRVVREIGDRRLGVVKVDAGKIAELRKVVKGFDVVMNALPFKYDVAVTRACVSAGVSGCDVSSVEEQFAMDAVARGRGIVFVAGVGATPGITNIMVSKAGKILDRLEEVKICWAAFRATAPSPGLLETTLWEFEPNNPERVYFDGTFKHVPPFAGAELVDFGHPIGRHEVYYVPHPETKTIPRSFPSVRKVEVKGTWPPETMNMLRFLLDYGCYSGKPVKVGRRRVLPLQLIQEVLLNMPQAKTTRLWGYGLHVEVVGVRNGVRTKVVIKNSHPSMDRWGVNAYYNNVGIPLSVGAELIARGQVEDRGVLPPEKAYNPDIFIQELEKRGIGVNYTAHPV
jgi:saccharopine dehydrogenase-like NADP-dependent oxidoreductase